MKRRSQSQTLPLKHSGSCVHPDCSKGSARQPTMQFAAATKLTDLTEASTWGHYTSNSPIFEIRPLRTQASPYSPTRDILPWSIGNPVHFLLKYLVSFSFHITANTLFFLYYSCNHMQYITSTKLLINWQFCINNHWLKITIKHYQVINHFYNNYIFWNFNTTKF